MVTKKTAKAGARSASQKIIQTRRDVRATAKVAHKTAGRVEQHSDKFAEVLNRLAELEAKVKKMATDPVVMVPHETKRRVDDLEAKVAGFEERTREQLATKVDSKSFDVLDDKVGTIEHSVAEHQTTLDNHEDRIDAMEDHATSGPDSPKDANVKCRCAKGHEGKDPDCYVHGNSFDRSDRPSTTPPVEMSYSDAERKQREGEPS